jgi:hypothetical protein
MTCREVLIQDLMSGQYRHPARIVAFDPAQGWSRDVTKILPMSCAGALWNMTTCGVSAGICGNRWPSALSPPNRGFDPIRTDRLPYRTYAVNLRNLHRPM